MSAFMGQTAFSVLEKCMFCVADCWVQCADICDASRGTLSSYAYILMVIYFLQQRKPPVVPVLQEVSCFL